MYKLRKNEVMKWTREVIVAVNMSGEDLERAVPRLFRDI